jgi:hypothetical protein
MTGRFLTALAVLLTSRLAAPNIGHAQTFKVEKFDIKGDGGTDYVAVEAATGRVFVSRALLINPADETCRQTSVTATAGCDTRVGVIEMARVQAHAVRVGVVF